MIDIEMMPVQKLGWLRQQESVEKPESFGKRESVGQLEPVEELEWAEKLESVGKRESLEKRESFGQLESVEELESIEKGAPFHLVGGW
jgi:hypothetical protein